MSTGDDQFESHGQPDTKVHQYKPFLDASTRSLHSQYRRDWCSPQPSMKRVVALAGRVLACRKLGLPKRQPGAESPACPDPWFGTSHSCNSLFSCTFRLRSPSMNCIPCPQWIRFQRTRGTPLRYLCLQPGSSLFGRPCNPSQIRKPPIFLDIPASFAINDLSRGPAPRGSGIRAELAHAQDPQSPSFLTAPARSQSPSLKRYHAIPSSVDPR
jgi:hypothetical protein